MCVIQGLLFKHSLGIVYGKAEGEESGTIGMALALECEFRESYSLSLYFTFYSLKNHVEIHQMLFGTLKGLILTQIF